MYLLSDALAVPAVGSIPRFCKALVRAKRLCQVGIEATTLGQASKEVMQFHRQAVFCTAAAAAAAASWPLRRPSVALTYRQTTSLIMTPQNRIATGRWAQQLTLRKCRHNYRRTDTVKLRILIHMQFIFSNNYCFYFEGLTFEWQLWYRRPDV